MKNMLSGPHIPRLRYSIRFARPSILVMTFILLGTVSSSAQYSTTTTTDILSFNFSPNVVDVTNSAANLTVTLRIVDPTKDFFEARLRFVSSGSGVHDYWFSEGDRTSGTSRDGIYQRTLEIPRYSAAGNWQVSEIVTIVRENCCGYYHRFFRSSDLVARGFPTEFRVVNANETNGPVIEARLLPSKVAAPNETVSARIRATDELGVSGIQLVLSYPDGCTYYDYPCDYQQFDLTETDRTSGNEHDGIYELAQPIYLPRGSYSCMVYAWDIANNWSATECATRLIVGPAAFDFDGDGKADPAVFRGAEGRWYALGSAAGSVGGQWGYASDTIAPADYDGDGKTDRAIFRDGVWWVLNSTGGHSVINWGLAGDKVVPADYDGDGKADPTVFRDGIWWIRKSTGGHIAMRWGLPTDTLVPADYDADGKADPAVFRDGVWWIRYSSGGHVALRWGLPTDQIVPADYDGDGKTDPAVFRDGVWWIRKSTGGHTVINWGLPNDIPVPADYDGDGRADVAVFRNGTWWIRFTSGGHVAINWGLAGDIPVSAKVH